MPKDNKKVTATKKDTAKVEEEEELSMFVKMGICGFYMCASSTLTLINK